jgi:hypothetical protein
VLGVDETMFVTWTKRLAAAVAEEERREAEFLARPRDEAHKLAEASALRGARPPYAAAAPDSPAGRLSIQEAGAIGSVFRLVWFCVELQGLLRVLWGQRQVRKVGRRPCLPGGRTLSRHYRPNKSPWIPRP